MFYIYCVYYVIVYANKDDDYIVALPKLLYSYMISKCEK